MKLGTTQAQRKLFFSLARTRRELEKHGDVTVEALAAELNVEPQVVQEMEVRLQGDVPADAPVRRAGRTDGARQFADQAESPESEFLSAEWRALAGRRVREVVAGLSVVEQAIVAERLMADAPVLRKTLARRFGRSTSWVWQREMEVVAYLREALGDLREEAA